MIKSGRCIALLSLLLVLLPFSPLLSRTAMGAAIETPTGKRIPGRIIDESADEYKMETELPGGGKIIFNMPKEKVDLYGTVPGAGRIEDIKGKAEIKKAGRTRFTAARKYMSVHPGDEIRTGPNSKVVITLETTAISGVGANSEFIIESFEKNPDTKMVDIKIGLPSGELWSEVGRLKTKDSNFQVQTPAAVTGVRGTVFLVEVEKGTAETSVSVLSGKVGISSLALPDKKVFLGKSEALFIKRGQAPQKYDKATLIQRIAKVVRKWVNESAHFSSVTALAGIGQVAEIHVEATLPEAEKQKIYDAVQAGWEKASEDLFQIDKALKLFYLDFARFPAAEEGGLNGLASDTGSPKWNGPYIEADLLNDHYGVPYRYAVRRDIMGKVFAEITTFGYDKIPGTMDDRKKMVLEQDARRWEDGRSYR